MDTLFRSVIPGVAANPRPISGRGNPNGFRGGQVMQIYTEETGKEWCKSDAAATLGWFELGTARGHPQLTVGNFYETNPNGLYSVAGPAVWIGFDQSVWVKTVPTDDDQSWVLLGSAPALGLPDFYSYGGGMIEV